MKRVCSTLRHQRDLRSRGTARICVCIARRYSKFLYRIERCTKCTLECVTSGLIIIVDAIDGDIRLIAATAIHRAITAVGVLVDGVIVADKSYPWLQAENPSRITPLKGQIVDLSRIKSMP